MSEFFTPRIIKESYQGVGTYAIADDLLSRREITCVDPINADTANSLITQILYLAHMDPEGEIRMYINCPGGEVTSGLALYDVMQAVPCPIHTICVGIAASMGAVLFAAGDERDILPHAAVMIHDPLTPGISGSALEIKSRSENLMRTRETICGILAKHTGRTKEEIFEKTCADTYFYSDEAVAFGLADRTVENILGGNDNE